jgi:hypothetical protein
MKTNQYKFVGNVSANQQEKIISRIEKDFPGGEYLIATSQGQYQEYCEYVNSTLFAFYPKVLANYTGLSIKVFELLFKIGDESINEALSVLITYHSKYSVSFPCYLISNSILSFADALASYDHEEHEIEIGKKTFFIYRTN